MKIVMLFCTSSRHSAAALATGAGALIVGCGQPAWKVTPPQFKAMVSQIETVSPEDLSQSPPLLLSDAQTPPAEFRESGSTGQPLTLSLADVRAAALANNLDLKAELISPEIAGTFVREEEARFESLLFGSASHRRLSGAAHAGDDIGEAQQFDLGMRIPLRTGGFATVVVPFERVAGGERYHAGLQFSFSQPLLRGAGERANTHFIRVAQYQRGAVDARTKLEVIRILADADRAYWHLYAARAELDVRRQQYEIALRQVNESRLRVAARAAPRIEITRAESGLAARLEAIIVAETIVRRRERALKLIMQRNDHPVVSAESVILATQPSPVRLDLDPVSLSAKAIANRMEMLELELQLAADASEIDFQRNAALPLFVFDYTYSVAGTGTGFGDAFEAMPDGRQWRVGLRAEVPLGNESSRARVSRAILVRLQRLATRDMRRQSIEQEVFDVVDQLTQNWERILAARNETLLAARTYEAERRQFELNVRTSTDVLDAAARLADAQLREIRALADYEISMVDLAFATGTLLGHGRISLDSRTGVRSGM